MFLHALHLIVTLYLEIENQILELLEPVFMEIGLLDLDPIMGSLQAVFTAIIALSDFDNQTAVLSVFLVLQVLSDLDRIMHSFELLIFGFVDIWDLETLMGSLQSVSQTVSIILLALFQLLLLLARFCRRNGIVLTTVCIRVMYSLL